MNLKEQNNKNAISTISTFSGAGGLDIGAIKAGAKIVWANDMMKEACETYFNNIGEHIVRGNINEQIPSLETFKGADLVIGGPPCQGFSVAGKMDINDQRSQLIWSYANVIKTVMPKAFVMENVKALGQLEKWKPIRENLLTNLRSLGYAVDFMVLNASDFDVPQARERVFVVGFKGDGKKRPNLIEMITPYKKKAPTVREALSVLDKAGKGNNQGVCKARITLASNPVLRKSAYAGMIFNGLGRPIRIDGYCATLPASMGGNKTPIIDEHELYEHKEPWVVSYHKGIYENPSTAEFRPAPDFLRRLTVEEAAVIQTFPLDYAFAGSQSSKFTQIGNAVPCNLGYAVVKMVIDVLNGTRSIIFGNDCQTELTLDLKYDN